MKNAAAALILSLLISAMPALAPSAHALSCAADPDWLTYEEMIDQGTTGRENYPVMALGIVAEVRDLGGRKGGPTIARVAVAEHPAGFAPIITRVRFSREAPGVGTGGIDFRHGEAVVLIARRLADGTYAFDGDCGQTSGVDLEAYRALLKLARA